MQCLVVLRRETCHEARFAAWRKLTEMAVLSVYHNKIFVGRFQGLMVIDFTCLGAIRAAGVSVAQQDDARGGEAVDAWAPSEGAWSTGTILFCPAEDELDFVWERK
jgi:hypothetical protein